MTTGPGTVHHPAPAAAPDAFGTVLLPPRTTAAVPCPTPVAPTADRPPTPNPPTAPRPVPASFPPSFPPSFPLPGPQPGPQPRRSVLDVLRSGERRGREQLRLIRAPLHGSHRIAVVSAMGRVGRTSLVLALGSMLAAERGEPVAAVDAGAPTNSLVRRVRPAARTGLADLAAALRHFGPAGLGPGSFPAAAPAGLAVLGDPPCPGPGVAGPVGEADYRAVLGLLAGRCPITLTDSGPGLLDGPMRGVLDLADQLVLAGTPSVDGADSTAATLAWLHAQGYAELAERSVTVFTALHGAGRPVSSADLRAHFGTRCRGVVELPFDDHLAADAEFEPGRLGHRTRRAVRELAALIGDGFRPAGRPVGR